MIARVAAALALTLAGSVAGAQNPLVVFVHDQTNDEILRLIDRNADGDALDPGEATVFYDDSPPPLLGIDNAQGMVALDAFTLLATDNFDPDNVILMHDADRDGDALDPGESSVWFDGLLPIGMSMTNPAELRRRADGSYYLLDNNTLDTTRPEAIYILRDLNADDDVLDAGESEFWFELSPPGIIGATTFDVIEDNAGNVYTIDITDPNQIESLDIIDPDGFARTTWIDSSGLFNLFGVVISGMHELEYLPGSNEVVFGVSTLGGSTVIVAARDNNGSGTIDLASELRQLWSETASGVSTGSARDLVFAPDGSLLWTDGLNDRVMRLVHLNADADFNDAGETQVFYDSAIASGLGLPDLPLGLSLAAAILCTADFAEPAGQLDFSDVVAFLVAFAAMEADADLAEPFGQWDFTDVVAFLAAFGAGCP